MFDKTKIETALFGVVGLNQPYDPQYAILEPDLIVSDSGYFVDELPFINVQSIKQSENYKDISDVEFNETLRRSQKSAISTVANQVFKEPSFIDKQWMYGNAMNKVNTENIPDGFVGFKILVTKENDVAFKITRVALDFSLEGQISEGIEIMLFNSAKSDPIFSTGIIVDSEHKVVELNWAVDNTDNYYKGEFYLGYVKTNSMVMKPYSRDYGCSNILSNIKYIHTEPIKVAGHSTNTLFDLTTIDGLSEATGMNFDLTVYNDYSDLIMENQFLFAKAIQLQWGVNILTDYLSTLRSNRTQRQNDSNILRVIQELEGQSGEGVVRIRGLRPALFIEIKSLKKQIHKLTRGYFGQPLKMQTLG